MISSSTQLKAKVRNLSGGDNGKAQTLLRNFIMERFLERVSLSEYRDNFVLKGGMLVASVVGADMRTTMDIDTTVCSLALSKEETTRVVGDIIAVPLEDGVSFALKKIVDIMEGHDYPGIRCALEASFGTLCQAVKLDISTGDAITPAAVRRDYRLMFEDRSIPLWSYNLETLLAEKLETVMARGVANTRMRDFYDIHMIVREADVDVEILRDAFRATSCRRGTHEMVPELGSIVRLVAEDENMRRLWGNYVADSPYVDGLAWDDVVASVEELARAIR